MAIFPVLNIENKVQIGDTIRLDATRSYPSKGEAAITLVEIQPEASESFVDVTGTKQTDWFLDWQYAGASRTVDITVRVTTDGLPVTYSTQLSVMTVADDALFSTDSDLMQHEQEILKFLPKGKTTFISKHRRAQELIVEHFNERGVIKTNREKLNKLDFVDIEEVKQWSIALTLGMIFQDNSNVVGDIWSNKANEYFSQAVEHRTRAYFRIDLNGDGAITGGELNPVFTVDLVRS